MTTTLPAIIAEHIRAVNAFDLDAIVKTFASDAYVNDNRREMVGEQAIRRWVAKELVGDKVTMKVRNVREHHGEVIVDALYDGNYDKKNLPAELVLTNYFILREGKIASLKIIFNQPSPYA
jgi:hypothetical protein